jgi:hypothetical protein
MAFHLKEIQTMGIRMKSYGPVMAMTRDNEPSELEVHNYMPQDDPDPELPSEAWADLEERGQPAGAERLRHGSRSTRARPMTASAVCMMLSAHCMT